MDITKKIFLSIGYLAFFTIIGIIMYNIYIYFSLKYEENNILNSPEITRAKEEIIHIADKNSSEAFLLIHGYGGSPYDMKPLTEELILKGKNVFVPCIEGHCLKNSKHFGKTKHKDWLESAQYNFNKLKEQGYNSIHVIGFSMGGLLAIELGNNEELITDITLISPFTEVTHEWYYGLTTNQWNSIFSNIVPYVKKLSVGRINDSEQKANYIPSYMHLSTQTALELDDLSKSQWGNIKTDVFPKTLFIYSTSDEVSSPEKMKEYSETFFNRAGDKHIEVNKSNHIILHDYEKNLIIEEILDFTGVSSQ